MQLVDTLNEIKSNYGFKSRDFQSISFGSSEECKQILSQSLQLVDPTMKLQWLPEYNKVAEWMSDTKAKGLLLTGDCGRGKSNIVMFALPLLFLHKLRKVVKPVHIDNLHANIDSIIKRKIISIDEIGAEPILSDFGSKYYPFMKVINAAEVNSSILLLSTNLNGNELRDKYDERTLDRIIRLCEIIKFEGPSLRK